MLNKSQHSRQNNDCILTVKNAYYCTRAYVCMFTFQCLSVLLTRQFLFSHSLISFQFARFETIDLSQVALAETSCRNISHSFCVSKIENAEEKIWGLAGERGCFFGFQVSQVSFDPKVCTEIHLKQHCKQVLKIIHVNIFTNPLIEGTVIKLS